MPTANVIQKQFETFSISNVAGDTVKTKNNFVRVKNLGANAVSFSEAAAPAGVATSGHQSTINPAGATGRVDDAILRPNTTYFFTADAAPTLMAFDEYPSFPSY